MTDNGGRARRRAGRELMPLGADHVAELPSPCVACLFWEHGPAASATADGAPAGATPSVTPKQAWIRAVTAEWAPPGRVIDINGRIAGYVSYAPAPFSPRTLAFPTAPIAEDALALFAIRVRGRYAGQGLGRVLIQTACKDALQHGYRAIEAFGAHRPPVTMHGCVVSAGFLSAVGFETVRDHPAYPRMRLDLRAAVGWREDVENALGRLLAPIRGLGQQSPVGTSHHDISRETHGGRA
ncbi:MAG: GNAT family N-acetyltransferase [Dermatophilaceae bacterium]|nr:GNAT family N-acetyltransferase [Actinomycetales bacterium]MBP9919001.1 GNAT family N-acetyltransferase [Dermatophilaceae bacterium]